jgi:hypothetical protein
MLMTGNHAAEIEDILAILGADGAAELSIAASCGLSSVPGTEYVVKLRTDPRKMLALPMRTAQALLAAGAVLADD